MYKKKLLLKNEKLFSGPSNEARFPSFLDKQIVDLKD